MAIQEEVLRRAGITLSPERFTELVEQVIAEFPVQGAARASTDLTLAEAEELHAGGLDLSPLRADEDDPLARTAAAYATLLATSLTVPQAADRLGVDPSRVRQRLAARTLYGIRRGGGWRIATFQFEGNTLLPGIGRVLARLPAELHPMVVFRWFHAPDPDLTVDSRALSPRDWLRLGNDPERVAAIAADLAEGL